MKLCTNIPYILLSENNKLKKYNIVEKIWNHKYQSNYIYCL